MTSRNTGDIPHVSCVVIDEDTVRFGGSNFKREKTCHNTNYPTCRNWICSECGGVFETSACDEHPFSFCPGCGRKVE